MEHSHPAQEESLAQQYEAIAARFLALEALATEMILCPEEELPQKMERRLGLAGEVDALRAACAGREPASPEEEERVRLARDEARAAVCRIRELDGQAMRRLRRVSDGILEKLRAVERSSGARARRYYQPPSRGSTFYGNI